MITCGKAGFRNTKNEISQVSLRLLEGSRKVSQAVYSRPYVLRAEISKLDTTYGFRVKSCFAFDQKNSSVALIDDRGCPVNRDVIDNFVYHEGKGYAEAQLQSMFRFPDSSEVHFQVGLKCLLNMGGK